jgi:dipeptidyl aminopeptidase/acylaminoacyl peptidase
MTQRNIRVQFHTYAKALIQRGQYKLSATKFCMLRSKAPIYALAILVFHIVSFAQAQRQLAPLPVGDVIRLSSFPFSIPVDMSPDGQWVAYTLQNPGKRETSKDPRYSAVSRTGVWTSLIGSDVWITSTQTGESRNLTEGKGTSWGPVWSPDGRRLVFYSDRSGLQHVWLWEKSSGKLSQVSDAIISTSPISLLQWTTDGKKIIAKVLPEGMSVEDLVNLLPSETNNKISEATNAQVTVTVRRSEKPKKNDTLSQQIEKTSVAGTNVNLGDVALIDIASGDVRRLARRAITMWFGLSPNGEYVAFDSLRGLATNSQQFLYDLHAVSIETGEKRTLASDIQSANGLHASWSPNGRWVAYTTAGGQAKGDCFLASIAGDAPRNMTPRAHPNLGSALRAPLWDPAGQFIYLMTADALWRISPADGTAAEIARVPERKLLEVVAPHGGGRYWSPDGGHSLVLVTRDDETKRVGFYKVDTTSGASTRLIEEDKSHGQAPIYYTDVSSDGKQVVYMSQDAGHCPDLWVAGSDFQGARRFTNTNPELDSYVMGKSRLIEWHGIENRKTKGALILPADYQTGKTYPLVVIVYAGNFPSNQVNDFEFGLISPQLLATRGYAVLLPDIPTRVGTTMQDIAADVLPGIDKAIEIGVADPDRLGVMGHSFGGYTTMALVVQTTRFKAAVDSAGFDFLMDAYSKNEGGGGNIGWVEQGQTGMGGSVWQYRDRYIENSPFFFYDKVQTPVLILHGDADVTTPSFSTQRTFESLRRLGKEVVYATYAGENHSPLYWGDANRLDYYNRVLSWFDEHLKKLEDK